MAKTNKTKTYQMRSITVEAYKTAYPVEIHTPHGAQWASTGDYIVTREDGIQEVYSPEWFTRLYERVKD
jgi:hypothetical protein